MSFIFVFSGKKVFQAFKLFLGRIRRGEIFQGLKPSTALVVSKPRYFETQWSGTGGSKSKGSDGSNGRILDFPQISFSPV